MGIPDNGERALRLALDFRQRIPRIVTRPSHHPLPGDRVASHEVQAANLQALRTGKWAAGFADSMQTMSSIHVSCALPGAVNDFSES